MIMSSDQTTKFHLTPDVFKVVAMILVPVFENLHCAYAMEGS